MPRDLFSIDVQKADYSEPERTLMQKQNQTAVLGNSEAIRARTAKTISSPSAQIAIQVHTG